MNTEQAKYLRMEKDGDVVRVEASVQVFYIAVQEPGGRERLFKAFRTAKGGFQLIKA